MTATRSAIGLTVKSGWASAVLLMRRGASLQVVDCRTVMLADPDDAPAQTESAA